MKWRLVSIGFVFLAQSGRHPGVSLSIMLEFTPLRGARGKPHVIVLRRVADWPYWERSGKWLPRQMLV